MISDRSPTCAEALPGEVRENFPPDMLALRRYVVWRFEERVGKSAKIPYVADGTGARASSTDPATWRGFEAAARVFLVGGYDGLGFVFSPGDPYAGVDLDDCRDPESASLEVWASELVATLEGYAEVSPSGTGVHVIVRGAAPNRQACRVEAYSSGRYFTVTGRAIFGHALPPPERQEGLNMLAQKYLSGATGTHVIARSRRGEPGRLSDMEVDDLCRGACNGEEYVYLVGHGGIAGNGDDHLEAERALARLIASHTKDAAQVGRLMDRALLGQRPEWRERVDHRTRTIEFAIAEAIGERCKGPTEPAVRRIRRSADPCS
jgi:putative DNA primase/helicase